MAVDRLHATLTFDPRTITVAGTVTFSEPVSGHVLLDLVPDGITAQGATRYDTAELGGLEDVGRVLHLRAETRTVQFTGSYRLPNGGFVKKPAGLWFTLDMTDLSPRGFLERYLPSPLPYQRIAELRITVVVPDRVGDTVLRTNGTVEVVRKKPWTRQITWAGVYPCDPFLHLTPRLMETERRLPDGRILSVFTDAVNLKPDSIQEQRAKQRLASFADRAADDYAELSRELGPPPGYAENGRDKVLVYFTHALAPMEFRDAVRATRSTVRHELAHLWVGRGLRPGDGEATWIDEGFACLVDRNRPNGRRHAPPDREEADVPDEDREDGEETPRGLARGDGILRRSTPLTGYSLGPRALRKLYGVCEDSDLAVARTVFESLRGFDGELYRTKEVAASLGTRWAHVVRRDEPTKTRRHRRQRKRDSDHQRALARHGGDQIWQGPVFIVERTDSGDQLTSVGFRSVPIVKRGRLVIQEYWAHLPGRRLQAAHGQTVQTLFSYRAGELEGHQTVTLVQFGAFAAEALDTDDFEMFSHEVEEL